MLSMRGGSLSNFFAFSNPELRFRPALYGQVTVAGAGGMRVVSFSPVLVAISNE